MDRQRNVVLAVTAVLGILGCSDTVLAQAQLRPEPRAAAATLSISPSTLPPFLWQTGTAAPAAQQVEITALSGTAGFSARLNPPVTWLTLAPATGTAAPTATVILTPAAAGLSGLASGTQSTSLIITPAGGTDLPGIPVQLIVSANPLLQVSSQAFAFTSQTGAAQAPPAQSTTISATDGSAQGFSFASDQAWLLASPSSQTMPSTTGTGTTPASLSVSVNTSSLNPGEYSGSIAIQPVNGDHYTEFIQVALSITSAASLTVGPSALLFSYEQGQQTPAAQTIMIGSTGDPLAFTVTSGATSQPSCPNSNWLSATPSTNTTPATLSVSVNTGGMTPGICSGSIQVSYSSGSGQQSAPQIIGVTVAVSSSNELSVVLPPGFGIETAAAGGATVSRTIALSSTDPSKTADYNIAAVSSPSGWLAAIPGSGSTPAAPIIVIDPSGLTAYQQYSGAITISSSTIRGAQLTLPVSVTVTPNVTVTASSSSLTFQENQGGPAPAPASFTLNSAGGGTALFTSSIQYGSGSGWLQVSPSSGQASGPVQVTVLPNSLTEGQYTAQIALAIQGAVTNSINVQVTLTVGAAQTVTAALPGGAQSLSFAYQLGGTAPASQTISISSSNGPVNFSVGTVSGGWLSVDKSSGTTPQTITVSANTQGLAAQSYNGSISISAPGVLASPIVIPVTLTVTSTPTPQPVTVLSNASNASGFIAPGEIITIKGNALGPASPASGTLFQLNAAGGVDPTLAGVQVLFDNVPGTPIYVSQNQINVTVPYEVAGKQSTNMVVTFQGAASVPLPLALAPVAPGLYTDNFSGGGQVAALNQDGTYNGAAATTNGVTFEPAPRGSAISIYGTGGGQTSPAGVTGSVTPIPQNASQLLTIPGPVTATVGGQPAAVLFAGAAPGLVTGAVQINVVIPLDAPTGNSVPVTISIGNVTSPVGTTIAIQ